MFSLHYALAVVLACILIHLILVHRSQPGAVSSASDNHVALADVVLKDFILIPSYVLVLLPLALVLIHPDNWQTYDSIATPAHIEPEVYFL